MIGKTEDASVKAGLALYEKRLGHYLDFRINELPAARGKEPKEQKEKDGETLLKKLNTSDVLILLDENGTEYDIIKVTLSSGDTLMYEDG